MPAAFISYSWDTEPHKAWVRHFADHLLAKGIEVLIDLYDVEPGDDLHQFMDDAIATAQYVLIICTPNYVRRANDRVGGVGIETTLITPAFFDKHSDKKFIPILRSVEEGTPPMPRYLGSTVYVDFTKDALFDTRIQELALQLHGRKRFVKPPVGSVPMTTEWDRDEIDRLRNALKRSARSFRHLRENKRFTFTDQEFIQIITDFNEDFAFRRIKHVEDGKRIIPGRPGICLKHK